MFKIIVIVLLEPMSERGEISSSFWSREGRDSNLRFKQTVTRYRFSTVYYAYIIRFSERAPVVETRRKRVFLNMKASQIDPYPRRALNCKFYRNR